MIRHAKLVAFSLVARALVGCSSDHAGGGSSCGGDLAGAWQIDSESLTIDSPFDQPECQSAIRDAAVQVQGSVTYSAGDAAESDAGASTQTSSLSYAFSATERYSNACLKALSFDGATADACHGLEILWAGAVSVTCMPDGDACQCDFADRESADDTVTYRAANGQILVPGADPVDYCVQGNTLVETARTKSSHVVLSLHRMP